MRHRDPLTAEQRARARRARPRARRRARRRSSCASSRSSCATSAPPRRRCRPAFAARLEHEVAEGFPTSQERVPLSVRRPLAARRWVLLPAAGSLAAVLVALVVVLGGDRRRTAPRWPSTADRPSAPAGSEAASPADAGGGSTRLRRRRQRRTAPARGGAGRAAAAAAPSARAASRRRPRSTATGRSSAHRPRSRPLAPARSSAAPCSRCARPTTSSSGRPTRSSPRSARFGGIVASSQIGASDVDGGEASFDLRIPTERLDRALAALSKLGHVTERNQSLQDITSLASPPRRSA